MAGTGSEEQQQQQQLRAGKQPSQQDESNSEDLSAYLAEKNKRVECAMHFSWNATQVQGVLSQMESRLDTMSESVISKLDDMGCRIDELERSIGELLQHASGETSSAEHGTCHSQSHQRSHQQAPPYPQSESNASPND